MKSKRIIKLILIVAISWSSSSYAKQSTDNYDQEVIGHFSNDEEYFQALDLLMVKAKGEVVHCQEYVLNRIIPLVDHKKHFTDIGPGDGQLTKLVSRHFETVTIVDKSQQALNGFSSNDFEKNTQLSTCQELVENYKFDGAKSDLILFSHVLYYVDREKWLDLSERAYSSLNEGGVLAIIFNDGLDRGKLLEYFGAKPLGAEDFFRDCLETFPNAKVELYTSIESMFIENLDEMVRLIGFYLNDVKKTSTREIATNYSINRLQKPNGVFNINTKQYFLIVKKLGQNEYLEKNNFLRNKSN